jgi:hypothetical protein
MPFSMLGSLVTPRTARLTIALLAAGLTSACAPVVSAKVKRKGVISNEIVPLTGPEVVIRFDVNGDTLGDVVVTNGSGVTVFLANADPTLDEFDYTTVDIPSPTPLGPAYGGTFDRDAFKDLVARTQAGLVMVLDLGSPTPGAPVPILNEDVEPYRSATCVGDFDLDGDDDIATCLQITDDRPATSLRIVINNTPVGENTEPSDWTPGELIEVLPRPVSPIGFFSVEAGRINNDANPDLLVCYDDGCYALAGNGDCTFDPIDPATGATIPGGPIQAGSIPSVPQAFSGHLEDLDQDGDSDLIAMRLTPVVHLNNGSGVFGPAQPFGGGLTGHAAPIFLDIDSSGTLDIVTVISASSTINNSFRISVTKVNADGTLQPTTSFPTITQPTCAAPFIPEPGAEPGLLVASFYSNRLTLHRNTSGALVALQRYYAESFGGARSVAAGDLTGDGYPDVYYTTFQTVNRVLVNRGDGSGVIDGVIPGQNVTNADHITFIERPALASGTVALARNSVVAFSNIINNGTLFRFTETLSLPSTARGIAKGDFNFDTRPDALVLLDTPNPGVAICYQNAAGTFDAPVTLDLSSATTPQGWWTICAPIDVDAAADSFAVYGPGGAGVFRNNGSGFDFFSAFGTGFSGGVRLAAGDLNADGKHDLVVARDLGSNTGALTIAFSTNPGGPTPTFAPPITINLIGAPGGLALSDLDNDDDLDLAVACNTGGTGELHYTVVMLNNGAGGFPDDDVSIHLAGNAPKQLLAADLHNPAGSPRRGPPASTAGAELIIASGGPGNTPFEGVQVLQNLTDFAAAPLPCPGDADASGSVSFADITSVLGNFGNDYTPGTGAGDADRNGAVNFADITSVLGNFGTAC